MNSAIQRRSHRRRGAAAQQGMQDHPFFEISESVALLEQATEANQRQIQQVAENTSHQIAELANNTSRQLQDIAIAGEKRGSEFQTEMKAMATEFARSRQTNWPLVISFIGLFVLLIGGAYQIVNLSTQVTMAPVVAKADVSEKDRTLIHLDIDANRIEREKIKSDIKVIEAGLKEVETQFRASDQAKNVQFAEQQRMNAIIYQIAQGLGGRDHPIVYPPNPYFFPAISDHAGGSEGKP
jgi:hypothetical protein